eukprot:12990484-Alexandrium_andersonii.AAC.1
MCIRDRYARRPRSRGEPPRRRRRTRHVVHAAWPQRIQANTAAAAQGGAATFPRRGPPSHP